MGVLVMKTELYKRLKEQANGIEVIPETPKIEVFDEKGNYNPLKFKEVGQTSDYDWKRVLNKVGLGA
jgi:hypothetical protein